MGRSSHRSDVTRRRKREQAGVRARETQAAQQSAALRAAWQQSRRRKAIGWAMIALGPIVGLSHLLQHAGAYEIMSPGLADVFIGYPTAFVLVIVGLILLGRDT